MDMPAVPLDWAKANARVSAAVRLGLALAAMAIVAAAHAGARTSANYSIAADTFDAGGGPAASANYAERASTGTIAGISTVADPAVILRAGFLGRLYETTSLLFGPPSGGAQSAATVAEGGTLQLSAAHVLDDATLLPLSASSVTWSIASGPLASLSAGGLASAGIVYADTPAVIGGTFGGLAATLTINVQNVNADDFGLYAGDTLPDDWQVQFFGLENPSAAPGADTTGSGQTNFFKYTAGLDPTNPADVFTLAIEPVENEPAMRNLVFTPVFAGRTYAVEYTADLTSGVWLPLTGAPVGNYGLVRIVTDPAPAAAQVIYRVRITKP